MAGTAARLEGNAIPPCHWVVQAQCRTVQVMGCPGPRISQTVGCNRAYCCTELSLCLVHAHFLCEFACLIRMRDMASGKKHNLYNTFTFIYLTLLTLLVQFGSTRQIIPRHQFSVGHLHAGYPMGNMNKEGAGHCASFCYSDSLLIL